MQCSCSTVQLRCYYDGGTIENPSYSSVGVGASVVRDRDKIATAVVCGLPAATVLGFAASAELGLSVSNPSDG